MKDCCPGEIYQCSDISEKELIASSQILQISHKFYPDKEFS